MDSKELIADIVQAAKDIRSEGYQIAAGYYMKAADALTAADAHIAAQDARIEALEGERDAFRIDRDKFAASLIEHNEILRSAISVGERDGKQTNWPAFMRRCSKIATDHHGRVNQAKAALGGEHGG